MVYLMIKNDKSPKWECPFERIREYPDCFQDCPDTGECKMKDSWKQTRPLPKLKDSVSFPVDIKHYQLIPFIKAMDEVLCKNDHKGGWQDCDIQYLRARLVEEMGEYFAWASRGSPSSLSEAEYKQSNKELIDIANFCLMLWDRS
jgi:NTP pyrophosphatase (non-canonical NTP hydrolase)